MVPAWNGTRQQKKLKLKKCCILSNSCNWKLFSSLLLFFQTFLQLIIWWCTKFEKFSKFLANMLLLQSREEGKFWTWILWKDKCHLFVKSSRRRKTLISHEALNWWPLDFVVSELQRTCWSAKAMYRVLSYSLLSHTVSYWSRKQHIISSRNCKIDIFMLSTGRVLDQALLHSLMVAVLRRVVMWSPICTKRPVIFIPPLM